MKRIRLALSLGAAGLTLLLTGCVVAPVGPGPVAYRHRYVGPPVYVGPPAVIVRPGPRYCGWQRCWR